MATEFRLLGEIQMHVDGQPVDLGHARQRFLLVALLVDANRLVPVDRLLDRVWGSGQPRHARNAVSGYVSRLRRILDGVATITRRPDGYLLAVDPDTVDMFLFRRLVRPSARPESLERALALWRGEPFGTLDAPWLTGIRAALAAERLTAELDLVDAALAAGRHAELVGELATRAAEHPFDERIAGQLMTALYRCGRRADALRHYQEVRDRLVDELGMDPTAELGRLHQRILASDLALGSERPVAVPGDGAAGGPVPRQLPALPAVFTGREAALSRLDGLTSGAAVVSGCAGVGKSALAVYWAHRVAARFPDGQLYVNLRGFDPDGVVAAPAEVVRAFLEALGVSARRLPIGLAAQTALFRSLLARRRMLVILDNARDAAQVRPLLPGSPGCLTVVTSRNQLGGLFVVDHAEPVPLDLFTDAEARAFLTWRLGASRIAGEPTAVAEIVSRCGRLPLALAVVAARAVAHPGFRLADVAAELGGGLDPFDGGDPHADVRAVFSWSYRALSPAGARLFRLLGLHPGPAFGADAAASVTGMPVPAARRLLTELTRAHLLTERVPGSYVMHDLLHAYAAEQAELGEPPVDRAAAVVRVLDHYLHTAYAADRMLYPHRDPVVLSEPAAGVAVGTFGDRAAAMAWLRAGHGPLVGAVEWAARTGHDRHCWELAWSLTSYFNLSGGWTDQVTVQRTALSAATRLRDDTALAHVHRNLGRAHTQLGRPDDARTHLDRALGLFSAVGDRANEAQTHVNVARVLEQQGHDVEALHHDQRSLDLYGAAGHLTGQARALNNVAWMLTRLGDVDLARTLCGEALRINEDIGNRHGAATNWQSIGHLELAAGAHRAAVDGCRRALDLFAEIGDRAGTADTLVCLGEAYRADGDPAAEETWRRALTLLDEMGHPEADRVRGYLRPAPAAGAGRSA